MAEDSSAADRWDDEDWGSLEVSGAQGVSPGDSSSKVISCLQGAQVALAGVTPVLICTASLVRRCHGVALVGKSWQLTPTKLQRPLGAGLEMEVPVGGFGDSPVVFLTLFSPSFPH